MNLTACYRPILLASLSIMLLMFGSAMPLNTPPVCDTPAALSHANVTETSADLGWGVVVGATEYRVRFRIVGAGGWTNRTGILTNAYPLSGLDPGTGYEWQVRADCNGTLSNWSVSDIFVTVACPAPQSPAHANVTEVATDLSWSAVGNATGYRMRFRTLGAGGWTNRNNLSGNTYNLNSLTPGTSYEWQARTECNQGLSNWSGLDTFTTIACNAPQNPAHANVTETTSDLSWDAAGNATGYRVRYRILGAGGWTNHNGIPTNTHNLTNLTPGAGYEWQARTECNQGLSDWGALDTFMAITCGAPQNPAHANVTETTSDLSWDAAGNATGYRVRYRILGAGGWANHNGLPGNTDTLTNLTPGASYEWQARTECNQGLSDWGALDTFTTVTCDAPQNFDAGNATVTTMGLMWDVAPHATSYNLRFRALGAGGWTNRNGIDSTHYTLANLTPGTSYELQVRAACNQGLSAWSTLDTLMTVSCDMPTNPAHANETVTTVDLSWSVIGNATEYRVRFRALGAGGWTNHNGIPTNTDTLTNLTPGVTYEWQARSVCGAGRSMWSALDTFTTVTCDAPQFFYTDTVTTNSIALRWSSVSNATSYRVRYRPTGGGSWHTHNNLTDTTDILSNLAQCTDYEVEVRTTCGAGYSVSRNQVFRTASPYPPVLVDLGRDTTLRNYNYPLPYCIYLDAGNPGRQYLWSTGDTTQAIYFCDTISTSVSVQVFQGGCRIGLDTLRIRMLRRDDFDFVIFDYFGKKYDIHDIAIPATNSQVGLLGINAGCGCESAVMTGVYKAGLFNLYFRDMIDAPTPNQGFADPTQGAARRKVVCQVFRDLSELIDSPTQDAVVKIDVQSFSDPMSGVLAAMTPYFLVFQGGVFGRGGILDTEIWKTINTGQDSYSVLQNHVSPPEVLFGLFHGKMKVNFGHVYETDYTNNSICTAANLNTYDMYSITLHESLHGLGVASLIDADGASKYDTPQNGQPPYTPPTGLYSRYDTYLKAQTGDGILVPLVNGSCYTHGHAANTAQYIAHRCTSATNPKIIFDGTSQLNVYTSHNGVFSRPSSLSHFYDPSGCPDNGCNNYVMCAGYDPCTLKRTPSQPEVNVLCDLGYKFRHTPPRFGSDDACNPLQIYTACPSCQIAGADDEYDNGWVSNGTTYNLDVLSNDNFNNSMVDHAALRVDCVELIRGFGVAAVSANGQGIDFTPAQNYAGWALIRYVPKGAGGCNGRTGNITYVYVRIVSPPPPPPPPCPQPDGECSNYVCFGDFEENEGWTANDPAYFQYNNFMLGGRQNTPDVMRLMNQSCLPCVSCAPTCPSNNCNCNSNSVMDRMQFGTVNCNILYGEFPPCGPPYNYPPPPTSGCQYLRTTIIPGRDIEGAYLPLNRPLVNGQYYKLKLWMYVQSTCNGIGFNVGISDNPPCPCTSMPPTWPPQGPRMTNNDFIGGLNSQVNCGAYTYNTLQQVPIQGLNQGTWNSRIQCFRFNSNTNGNFLILYPAREPVSLDIGLMSPIYIDDVSLVPVYQITPETLGNVCQGVPLELQYKFCRDACDGPECNDIEDFDLQLTVPPGFSVSQFPEGFVSNPENNTIRILRSFRGCSTLVYTVVPTEGVQVNQELPIYIGYNGVIMATQTVTVRPQPFVTSDVPAPCQGVGQASIDLTVVNCDICSYNWSPISSQQQDIQNLNPGDYTVTVTNEYGCRTIKTITVPPPLVATTTQGPCSPGGTADVTVNVTSGPTPHQFIWSDGQNGNPAVNLTPGDYTVTVTDGRQCQLVLPVTVTCTGTGCTSFPTVSLLSMTPVLCFGGNNGAIFVTASGGSGGNYTYSLNGGNFQPSSAFIGLAAGTYTVTVRDGAGCQGVLTGVLVSGPAAVLALVQTGVIMPSCAGQSTGSFQVTASGGTPVYSYSLDGQAFQPNNMFMNLSQGPHTVAVTDANNCPAAPIIVQVPQVSAPILSVQQVVPVTCNGGSNGSITVTQQAGYQYALGNGAFQQNNVFANLSAGNYEVRVLDGNGCTAMTTVQVLQPQPLTVSLQGQIGRTCVGQQTGRIQVAAAGGTAPYSFLWNNGVIGALNTTAGAGVNTVTVTDASGCTTAVNFTVLINPQLTLATPIVTNVMCNGESNGKILVVVNIPTAGPYQYVLNTPPAEISLDRFHLFQSLTAGNYVITVIDDNGCTATTATITITEPPVLSITGFSVSPDCVDNTALVTVNATGGTPPYLYQWTNNITTNTNSQSLSNGTYTVTVTDAHGCFVVSGPIVVNCIENTCPPHGRAISGMFSTAVSQYQEEWNAPPPGTGGGWIVNQGGPPIEITVNGDLAIDVPVTFYNVQFYMGPGARIVLQQNLELIFDACTLQCCSAEPQSAMWQGIFADNGDVYLRNHTHLECADHYGIEVTGLARCSVVTSHLVDNLYHIYVHGCQREWTLGAGPLDLKGSTLEALNLMHPPHTTRYARFGVYAQDMGGIPVQVGDPSASQPTDRNLFRNVNVGVQALQANVNLYANDFTLDNLTISAVHSAALPPNRVGVLFNRQVSNGVSRINPIYSLNIVTLDDDNQRNVFSGYIRGVLAYDAETLNVEQARFNDMTVIPGGGYAVESHWSLYNRLVDNEVTGGAHSFLLGGWDGAGFGGAPQGIDILRNRFSGIGTASAAIFLKGLGVLPQINVNIRNNQVNGDNQVPPAPTNAKAGYGVSISDLLGADVYIEDNYFYNVHEGGIFVIRTTDIGPDIRRSFSIQRNTIDNTYPSRPGEIDNYATHGKRFGIAVAEIQRAARSTYYNIAHNNITRMRHGINVQGNNSKYTSDVTITENIINNVVSYNWNAIDQNNPELARTRNLFGPAAGISCRYKDAGNAFDWISLNTIEGYTRVPGAQGQQPPAINDNNAWHGIYLENRPITNVCENTIRRFLNDTDPTSRFWSGITARGNCNRARLQLNKMSYCSTGVAILNQGVIGPQFTGPDGGARSYSNDWQPVADPASRSNQTIVTYNSRGASSDFAFLPIPAGSPTSPTNAFPEVTFLNQPIGSFNCQTPVIINRVLQDPTRCSCPIVDHVATDPTRSCPPRNPTLLAVGSGGDGDDGDSQGAYTYNEVAQMEYIAQDTSVDSLYGPALRFQRQQQLYKLLHVDSTLRDSSSVLDSFYVAQAGGILDSLQIIDDLVEAALGCPNTAGCFHRVPLLIEALALNAALPASLPLLENHRQVNRVVFTRLLAEVDTLSPTQMDTLKYVARQCPYGGGLAVYEARLSLLLADVDTLDGVDACMDVVLDTVQIRNAPVAKVANKPYFNIYPNPAQDRVTLDYYLPQGVNADLQIYSIAGEKLYDGKLEQTGRALVELDIRKWAAGVYVCWIKATDGEIVVQKLVIVK